jgi:hypothetical protein
MIVVVVAAAVETLPLEVGLLEIFGYPAPSERVDLVEN